MNGTSTYPEVLRVTSAADGFSLYEAFRGAWAAFMLSIVAPDPLPFGVWLWEWSWE